MPFLRYIFILIYTLGFTLPSKAQIFKTEELDSVMQKADKPILVFIYTDWCKYCESMKTSSFTSKAVKNILNRDFNYTFFNGEQKQEVLINGQTFKFISTGRNTGEHELARELGSINGKLSYPTTVILNTKGEIVFQYNAYLDAEDLLAVLKKAKE